MKKQITHISVVQTSKVLALLYTLISLIYTFVGIPMAIFGSGKVRLVGIVYIFMPVVMLVIGFVMLLLCCWLYNVVANWVGGIEVTVEDK